MNARWRAPRSHTRERSERRAFASGASDGHSRAERATKEGKGVEGGRGRGMC